MNILLPLQSKIISIKDLTADSKLFQLDLENLHFTPGQFLMVSRLGFGEIPISLASSPAQKKYLELAIRSVGRVSQAIHQLAAGDSLWLRGPYGNGFPIHKFKHQNIILIAGGCGLAPLRSLIGFAQDHPHHFAHLQIFYGAKTPQAVLFQNEIKTWRKFAEVILTVDQPDQSWRENSGLISNLITPKTINIANSPVVMCGPPVMYESIVKKLLALGFNGDNIYLSLERNMQCGLGLCQHCTCGEKYVCKDGPVFTYNQVKYQSYKGD